MPNDLTYNDVLDVDNDVAARATSQMTDQEIFASVAPLAIQTGENSDDDCDDFEFDPEPPKKTARLEITKALETLQHYSLYIEEHEAPKVRRHIAALTRSVENNTQRTTTKTIDT